MSIAVIDYGSGNLKSAAKALEAAANNINVDSKITVTSDPEIIKRLSFIDRFELGYAYLDIEHNGEKDDYKNISHYLKHQLYLVQNITCPLEFPVHGMFGMNNPLLTITELLLILKFIIVFGVSKLP